MGLCGHEAYCERGDIKVSLFASAVRHPLFGMFLESLMNTSVEYEVVFAGFCTPEEIEPFKKYKNFRYIQTGNVKPSQCYEIARRACVGELVCWVADDCEFKNDVIGKAYHFWKSLNNRKAVLSIQTKEYYLDNNGKVGDNFCDMTLHSFIGGDPTTPRMAPLGLMDREYLDELGGIDRRYIAGQYENDFIMRVYADGGKVVMFGDTQTYIDIDHIGKQRIVQPGATHADFLTRPFATGYRKDRTVLEQSWCGGSGLRPRMQRFDKFEPFTDEDLLTKSQGPRGIWQ